MASSGSGYDLSSSTFSPDGRIFQVEYANKAVENAGTAIGIKTKDGVVLGVTKPLPHKMLIPKSGKRIHTLSEDTGAAMTGFVPDGRQIINRARDEASSYMETYGSPISTKLLSERMASYVHYFTLHGSLRPFGATCLFAGYDPVTSSPSLHMVEPNGVSFSYVACAAGKGRQPAKTELEKMSSDAFQRLTCGDAVNLITKILHMLQGDDKAKEFQIEMSWICKDSNYKHAGVPKDVMAAATVWAKQQLEAESDGDDDEAEMEE